MANMTPKQELANERLASRQNTTLATYIRTKRAEGKSWQDIAFALRTDVDMAITAESIRNWAAELGLANTTDTEA